MDGRVRLDQAFYGYGRSGYGLAGYSFDDEGAAWAAINVCLAIGQATGSRLSKSILLSRVLGDKIVMARICNGAKDSSGRNTLFVHALVGLSQEVSKAHVTAFTLEEAGFFRDNLSGNPVDAIEVAANPAPATASHEPIELPAAIETSAPDEKLIRRIVSGRENELSWSTFAFEDMPGYDVICISTLSSLPSYRAIYGQDMRLLRRRQDNATDYPKFDQKDASAISERPSPPSRDVTQSVGTGRKNKVVVALFVSIALNIALASVVWRMAVGKTEDTHDNQELVRAAKALFTEDKRVTKAMLESLDKESPLGGLYHMDKDSTKHYPEQIDLLRKLLAYWDFVEEQVLKRKKEK